jgi:hypothetical protein
MARPRITIDYNKFQKLYDAGYQDAEIARILGVDRSTVTRRRQAINLPANRKRGERGPAVKEDEPYWKAVTRVLKYVKDYISEAAREYYKRTNDFERFFICYCMEPKPMYHANPHAYYSDPQKMNYKAVQKIVEYEQKMDQASMAGVPGPAILELAKVYKSADEETCKQLAKEAVETAGFVNCDCKVCDVTIMTPPKDLIRFWKNRLAEILSWTPVKEWETAKRIRKATIKAKEKVASVACGRSGRRGKGGGLQSLNNHLAFQAAQGY